MRDGHYQLHTLEAPRESNSLIIGSPRPSDLSKGIPSELSYQSVKTVEVGALQWEDPDRAKEHCRRSNKARV
jgi:hypothetical protein